MRLHYLRGDRAAAQGVYWRLHDLLRDELGIRPSAETLRLFQTIEAAEAAPGTAIAIYARRRRTNSPAPTRSWCWPMK